MDPGRVKRPAFGVVGFGRFGALVAEHLRGEGEVVVYDPRPPGDRADRVGARAVGIEAAASARVVILCPPIRRMRQCIEQIVPHLLPRTLVVDTASVKTRPAREMMDLLPESIDCLGTHPLFGPDSAAAGLRGLRIVLCPLRRGHERTAERFLRRKGLEVSRCTPEDHDRAMAETQAIVQWIGRALERLPQPSPIATPGYAKLREILQFVRHDSWQLFADIQNSNPFAADARRRFLDALIETEAETMEDLVVVYRAAGITEAELVKGYLEAQGIPVDLDYESAGPVVGLTMNGLGEVRVVVPQDWEEEARTALARRPDSIA